MEELGHSCITKINFNIKQLVSNEAFGLLINRYCTNIDEGLSEEIPHKLFTK